MDINGHRETIEFGVTDTCGTNPVVLEIPWQRYHNVQIDYNKNELIFPDRCQSHNPSPKPAKILHRPREPENKITFINIAAFNLLTRKHQAYSITVADVDFAIRRKTKVEATKIIANTNASRQIREMIQRSKE